MVAWHWKFNSKKQIWNFVAFYSCSYLASSPHELEWKERQKIHSCGNSRRRWEWNFQKRFDFTKNFHMQILTHSLCQWMKSRTSECNSIKMMKKIEWAKAEWGGNMIFSEKSIFMFQCVHKWFRIHWFWFNIPDSFILSPQIVCSSKSNLCQFSSSTLECTHIYTRPSQ